MFESKANGLQRQHVPAHGNCLFEAVVKQAGENIDCTLLREQLCNHLQENSNYYSSFLDGQDILTELETLRQHGQWTNSLCDALPLAVANVLSVTVNIYSSNPDQPVITVVPSLVQPSEK